MKLTPRRPALLAAASAAGLAGFALRLHIYRSYLDADGLLLPSTAQGILVWGSLAVLGLLALLAFCSRFPREYPLLYPASLPGAVCTGCSAVLLIAGSICCFFGSPRWSAVATAVTGLVAGVCLLLTTRSVAKGRCPDFWVQAAVCLFFLTICTCQFRLQGHDPQLLNYVFRLFGWLCLSLAAYHRMLLRAKPTQQRLMTFFNLCAIFFNLTALSTGEDLLLHLGGVLWALANQCAEERT